MKKISCPLCDEQFTRLDGLHSHIEEDHEDNIPEGYTVDRYMYFIKTGKTHGNCVICKSKTGWNDSTGKYKRFCENPKCKEKYRETFKNRMVGKYGKTTLLDDPDQQRKMLANRHISGEYGWTDGTKKTYTGSYELDFLKMLDVFMNFDSSDIMTPSPHTYYYIYEGEKKFYIPDMYIPSLNLEIEIKDGGDNPNKHSKIVNVDKAKEKLKDAVMASQKDIEYIKIVNKNYDGFFKYLLDKKEKTANAENVNFGSVIKEAQTNFDANLNKKDIAINLDDWVSGKQKALLITGYCGSGKSTLADKLSRRYNARCISLDAFENYIWDGGNTNDPYANDDYIITFVKKNNIINQSKTKLEPSTAAEWYMEKFVQYCISEAIHRNERIIIEGYQIFTYINPKKCVDLPVIVLGTSYTKSSIRKILRDVKTEDDILRKLKLFKTSIRDARDFKEIDTADMREFKMRLGITEGWFDAKAVCIESPVDENPQISELLHNTLNSGRRIWLATDWHIWKFSKEKQLIYQNDSIRNGVNAYMDYAYDDDVLIYLGDLVDDEFQDKELLKKAIKSIKGHKILIKGNNDLFDNDFYKECGFIYVGYKLLWEGILFSHMPVENEYKLNCHGHLHGGMKYKIKYTNQVDVYTDNGEPVNLLEVIRRRKEYAEQITEVVEESYKSLDGELSSIKDFRALQRWMKSNIKYKHDDAKWRLQSPDEVLTNKYGDCHDQANFEYKMLKKMGYQCGRIFMIEYSGDKIYNAGATHTACWFKDMGRYYWIENAWGDQAGIHGDYRSLNDLKDDIAKRWKYSGRNDKLYMNATGSVKPGIDLTEYVMACIPDDMTPKKWYVKESYEPVEETFVSLNKFHKLPINDINVNKYKTKTGALSIGLKHLRVNSNVKGYIWIDQNDDIVAYVAVEDQDEGVFIIALETAKSYQGNGIGAQLLKIASSELNAEFLSVNKKNLGAKSLYDKNGWRVYRETDHMYFMTNKRSHIKESYEPVTEVSNKLRDLDQYFDFERFVNGDTNRLFITGLAGSSKMQLAKDLATAFNANYINLDLFTKTSINMMLHGEYYGGASREYVDTIIDFANKHIAINPDDPSSVDMPTHENIVSFINRLIKSLNPNKRYVIEGVYIYRYYEDLKTILMNESLIITQDSFKDTLKKFGMASMTTALSLVYDETNNPKSWFTNERNTLNAFSKDILDYRSNVNNMKYNDSIYPVYVVLMHSGSTMGNIVKTFTGDEFSHACISFDPSLRNMMSFGKNQEIRGFQLGMTNENIQQSFYRRPIPFALYVTFVDVKAYKAMKKTAYKILSQAHDMTYNFTGLAKYAMGLPAETANALFCSEFVATVLNSGGDMTDGLKPSEVKPESYKYMSKFKLVQKGVLTEYDMNETIRRVKMMKKK